MYSQQKWYQSRVASLEIRTNYLCVPQMDTTTNTSRMISLNGSNWLIWKPKIMDLLYCKDLTKPIEKMGEKPEKYDDEDWATMDRKSISVIR